MFLKGVANACLRGLFEWSADLSQVMKVMEWIGTIQANELRTSQLTLFVGPDDLFPRLSFKEDSYRRTSIPLIYRYLSYTTWIDRSDIGIGRCNLRGGPFPPVSLGTWSTSVTWPTGCDACAIISAPDLLRDHSGPRLDRPLTDLGL